MKLTPRERQMARAVAEGLSNTEVAERLGLTCGSTRVNLSGIYTKLGLSIYRDGSPRVKLARMVWDNPEQFADCPTKTNSMLPQAILPTR